MTYAITGATGQLGRLVVQTLKTKVPATEIVALVRDPAKGSDLGVETRPFDYQRTQGLADALAGVDVLLLISSNEVGQRLPQHLNVIEAAKSASVKRVVYTSLLHADRSPLVIAPEHFATEEALRASGLPFTILRNGWYTENYGPAIAGALAHGAVLGSAGEGKISAATRQDYASAAVEALLGSGLEGRVLELAGDEAWTLGDLAAEISRQTGRSIPYRDLPESEYAAALQSVGLPEPVAKMYAGFDAGASQGVLFDDSGELSRLIGRPTTPLAEFVGSFTNGDAV